MTPIPSLFKTQTIRSRLRYMHPRALELMFEMIEFCLQNGVDPEVTETVTTPAEDKELNRVSDSHPEGRAFDLRTVDWSREFLRKFLNHFNTKYSRPLGAISKSTGQANLIIHHDTGRGEHCHVQLNRSFALPVHQNLPEETT